MNKNVWVNAMVDLSFISMACMDTPKQHGHPSFGAPPHVAVLPFDDQGHGFTAAQAKGGHTDPLIP
ncbi:hypothetical protein, partial [Desulfosarcina cetonica]